VLAVGNLWQPPGTDYAELFVELKLDAGDSIEAIRKLVERSLDHARTKAASALLVYVPADNFSLREVLDQFGFARVNGYRRLHLRLASPPEEARFPSNLRLRTYSQTQDRKLLGAALQQSYEGLWGHKYPASELVDLVLSTFPHDAIFLLLDNSDQPMGMCKAAETLGEEHDSASIKGYIDAPGLTTPYRTPASFHNLTRAALRWLYERGKTEITLDSWGDQDYVIEGYRELGFGLESETPAYVLHIWGTRP
jgi:hypothetical protein